MGAIVQFIADLLNKFLPEPWNAYLAHGLLLLAILIGIYIVIRYFFFRNKIYIKAFNTPFDQEHFSGLQIANELSRNIKHIQEIHSEEALINARYTTSVGNPKHVNEDLENNFHTLVKAAAEINPITNLILYLINKFWAPLEIHGNIIIQDSEANYIVQIMKGGRPLVCCMANGELKNSETTSHIMETLAYKVILEISNKSLINKNSSIGTMNWMAFKAHTEALGFWQSPTFDIHNPKHVNYVDTKLSESINHDPNYVIAYYNRGTLSYLTYKDVQSNEIARHYFQEALQKIHHTQTDGSSSGRIGDRRLEGLALLGLSRCYSQLRHRYGHLDREIVDKAREAAQGAVRLLGSNAHSLSTLAFAWHCTETLDDVREGRKIYEQIIKKEPNKYPTVHNNMGYILMVGGKLLMEAAEASEAEEWYNAAQHHMDLVINMEGSPSRARDFSHANLGNLYRLRGDYQRAIESYHKALHFDPENSTYTNGLNELSLVYFDMGDMSNAMHYHRLALHSTPDRNHLLKLMRQVANTLCEKSHPMSDSVKSLYTGVSNTENTLDIMTWLAKVEALLKVESAGDRSRAPTPVVVPSSSSLVEHSMDTHRLVAGSQRRKRRGDARSVRSKGLPIQVP